MDSSSFDIIITLVIGGVLTFITNLLKKNFKNINPQFVVLFLALLLGTIYQLFIFYVPEAIRQEALNFVYGILTSAVFIYEFVWKRIDNSNSNQLKK